MLDKEDFKILQLTYLKVRNWKLSSKIRNKAMISQYSFSTSTIGELLTNAVRQKEEIRYTVWEERNKTLFTDGMTFYVENTEELTKILWNR